ncbi:cytochrome b5-like heme/steroid binding domain-containing protein [Coprinopsis sp. MPI-PUGE-AT-0042]|nr:cytochrome b5-like heme/steroid binding domain-containing protein [Coprinopsis sp. MPI-PUGE-AT-0042]
MVQSSTVVIYGLAFLIPVALVLYKATSAPKSPAPTVETKEEAEKPLKTIMQPPVAELDPPKDDPYTVEQLKEFDGEDPSKPIYVAIKGTIFDVSRKADVYGKGGSYHIFAGKDGSKGLGMSSLKPEHAISDYSELDEAETKVLNDWFAFFSKRYNIVGKVVPTTAPAAF